MDDNACLMETTLCKIVYTQLVMSSGCIKAQSSSILDNINNH